MTGHEHDQFEEPDSRERSRSFLNVIRVRWLPLMLVLIDGLLVAIALLIALIVLPILLVVLLLLAVSRWFLRVISGGRLFPKHRGPGPEAEVSEAGTTTLSEELRYELAYRYRPCIFAFGEDRSLGPPYRTDELADIAGADYNPRSVEIMLRHARLRRGKRQWLPDLPDVTPLADIRASLGKHDETSSSLEIPWLHGGNPLKIVRHLFPFGRQFKAHWALPVYRSDCGCSRAVWDRYMRIVEADAQRAPDQQRYPLTIYARVLEGRELPEVGELHPLSSAIAIQYWWFLFYNDAWNRHQGDWEGVTVFLLPQAEGYRPLGAAYGTHDIGRWRRWQDMQHVDDEGDAGEGTHPVVYMARGSHASYFDYNPSGYHPAMTRQLRIPFLGDYHVPSQFVLETRNAIDWVAAADVPGGSGRKLLIENVEVMPTEAVLRNLPQLRADDHWWWLAYRGLWGAPEALPFFGGSGPRGPRGQGVRWNNPFRWVMRDCMADDLPYWLEMFSQWEPEITGGVLGAIPPEPVPEPSPEDEMPATVTVVTGAP